jgi:hypothetical protein
MLYNSARGGLQIVLAEYLVLLFQYARSMRFQFQTKHLLIAIAAIAVALGTVRAAGSSMFAAMMCLFVLLPALISLGWFAGATTEFVARTHLEKWIAGDKDGFSITRIGVSIVAGALGLLVGIVSWIVGIAGLISLLAFFDL